MAAQCPGCKTIYGTRDDAGYCEACHVEPVEIPVLEEPLELYRSDRVTVYHGDMSAVIAHVGLVDVVITDPPYTEHVQSNIRSVDTSGPVRVRKWKPNFEPLGGFEHVPLLLGAAKRWCLAFCALESFGDYRNSSGGDWKKKGSYVRSGVWRKKQAAPQLSGDRPANSCEGIAIMHHRPHEGRIHWNGHGKHAYWSHAEDDTSAIVAFNPLEISSPQDFFEHGRERAEKRHPTQKPHSLMLELVGLFSDPGELILDPYCGSGATGAAALELGRRVILADNDREWAEFTANRMKELEGK